MESSLQNVTELTYIKKIKAQVFGILRNFFRIFLAYLLLFLYFCTKIYNIRYAHEKNSLFHDRPHRPQLCIMQGYRRLYRRPYHISTDKTVTQISLQAMIMSIICLSSSMSSTVTPRNTLNMTASRRFSPT